MNSKILPKDIESPLGRKKVYEAVAQNEEALILAVLVNASQNAGEWIYADSFPKRCKSTLKNMCSAGRILELDRKYMPTQQTIEKLFEFYPANN